jgi:hypothetical protein
MVTFGPPQLIDEPADVSAPPTAGAFGRVVDLRAVRELVRRRVLVVAGVGL